MQNKLWMTLAPSGSDAHGGTVGPLLPQPRGPGDATVPEWARRNLVTLYMHP